MNKRPLIIGVVAILYINVIGRAVAYSPVNSALFTTCLARIGNWSLIDIIFILMVSIGLIAFILGSPQGYHFRDDKLAWITTLVGTLCLDGVIVICTFFIHANTFRPVFSALGVIGFVMPCLAAMVAKREPIWWGLVPYSITSLVFFLACFGRPPMLAGYACAALQVLLVCSIASTIVGLAIRGQFRKDSCWRLY